MASQAVVEARYICDHGFTGAWNAGGGQCNCNGLGTQSAGSLSAAPPGWGTDGTYNYCPAHTALAAALGTAGGAPSLTITTAAAYGVGASFTQTRTAIEGG